MQTLFSPSSLLSPFSPPSYFTRSHPIITPPLRNIIHYSIQTTPSMLLKIHYNKETHLLNKKVNFQELNCYIEDVFKEYPTSYELTYLDSDNDQITISNDEDLVTLYGTAVGSFTKVMIHAVGGEGEGGEVGKEEEEEVRGSRRDQEGENQGKKENEGTNTEKLEDKLEKQELTTALEQRQFSSLQRNQHSVSEQDQDDFNFPVFDNVNPQQLQNPQQMIKQMISVPDDFSSPSPVGLLYNSGDIDENDIFSKSFKNLKQGLGPKKGEDDKDQKEEEKCQKIETIVNESNPIPSEKQQSLPESPTPLVSNPPPSAPIDFDKLFLDKLQHHLPTIVLKVKKLLAQQQIQQSNEIHKAQCQLCLIQSIKGIRYKCTVCPNFNLCSLCEQSSIHPHNLIKIRKAAEEKGGKIFDGRRGNETGGRSTGEYLEKDKRNEEKEIAKRAGEKVKYREKEEPDPKVIKEIMKNVKEIAGDSKEVEEFVYQNYKEGADRIVDMWFNK